MLRRIVLVLAGLALSLGARAESIPVMVMLRADGSVAHVHVGHGEDMLDSRLAGISALLQEPRPAAKGSASQSVSCHRT